MNAPPPNTIVRHYLVSPTDDGFTIPDPPAEWRPLLSVVALLGGISAGFAIAVWVWRVWA